MLTRIITGLMLTVFFLVPGIWLSHTFVLTLICSVFSCIGVYEIVKCFGQRANNAIMIPSMALGLTMPTLVRYTFSGNSIYLMLSLMAIYTFYIFTLPIFTNNKIAFDDIAKSALMSIYISVGFSCIIMLRDLNDGQYLFIMAFMGAWITDIFAYFTGMILGKHKLSPIISPKKTVEGAIGGVILCTLSFIGYGYFLNSYLEVNTNLAMYAILGFFASLVSQLGDLIMSAIKRKHDVKDYGSIFPGHGGVLDRFDSVIAVAPVLYLICYSTLLK